jgi:hypothetical protein
MRTAMLFVAVLASAGCLRKTEYKCSVSTECGTGGTCEAVGYCSFADTMCMSGRRFGEFSGDTYSGQCVGGDQPMIDAGTDGQMQQMDTMMASCPAGYAALTGGTTGHQYRVIAAAAAWGSQLTDCDNDEAGTKTYLAIPNDQGELTAILAAASASSWVGVEDAAPDDENFVDVKGQAYPTNNGLWQTGEPNDMPSSGGGAAECVFGAAGKLSDEKCLSTYAAVCECEP